MEEKKPKSKADIIREYDHFDLGNACSATECTGMIPTPPLTDEEMESYMSIMDYRAPDVIERQEAEEEAEEKEEKEKK